MQTPCLRLIIAGLLLTGALAQAQERESTRSARSSTTAKGPLPDPLLLDGSKEAAEKRPEHGMLGEFELPGNENAKSDKVGGAQPEEQSQGGGGSKSEKGGGGAAPAAAAAAAAAAQGGGGAGGEQKEGSGQNGQAGQNGQSGQGTESTGAQGAAGAKAEGIQASGLSDPANGEAASQSQASSPPSNMKIGDAALQIKTLPPGVASAVVGMEPQQKGKETPQSYDAKTPGGGKQSGGRGNQGVERGKIMPAGL